MKVNSIKQWIYTSKSIKKGLEFAADNGVLFAATTSLVLSTVARPLAIMSTPKTDKENKKLACAKSLASSLTGYGILLCASLPVAKGIKKINKNPAKYLKKETITNLTEAGKTLQKSNSYKFATQLFKLGLGILIAVPKSILTAAITPFINNKITKNTKQQNISVSNKTGNQISFKGLNKNTLPQSIGKIIDKKSVQNFAKKYKDTNFPMHIAAITDTISTLTFVNRIKKSDKIKPERKKVLNNNTLISTGSCIASGYIIDKMLKKPAENFTKKFKEINKNSPKLDKYVEGIKIAKPTLILGSVYYIALPVISTFLAERISKKKN